MTAGDGAAGGAAAGGAPSNGKRAAPNLEFDVFRDALTKLWKEAYLTTHGQLHVKVLAPLDAPPRAAWAAALGDSKHAVVGALRALRASGTPFKVSLAAWFAELQKESAGARPFDGAAVVALLCARYFGCGWFERGNALRATFGGGRLDAAARAKVWAAIEHMPILPNTPPHEVTPLQAAVDACGTCGDAPVAAAAQLAEAMYVCIVRDEETPAAVCDRIVDCIHDLVDMSEQMLPPPPPPASQNPPPQTAADWLKRKTLKTSYDHVTSTPVPMAIDSEEPLIDLDAPAAAAAAPPPYHQPAPRPPLLLAELAEQPVSSSLKSDARKHKRAASASSGGPSPMPAAPPALARSGMMIVIKSSAAEAAAAAEVLPSPKHMPTPSPLASLNFYDNQTRYAPQPVAAAAAAPPATAAGVEQQPQQPPSSERSSILMALKRTKDRNKSIVGM